MGCQDGGVVHVQYQFCAGRSSKYSDKQGTAWHSLSWVNCSSFRNNRGGLRVGLGWHCAWGGAARGTLPTQPCGRRRVLSMSDLPPRASMSCSSEGCGWFLSSVYMDITIPGVQNPHWVPWLLAILSWKDTYMVTGPAFLLPPPLTRVHILDLPCQDETHSLSSALCPSIRGGQCLLSYPAPGWGDSEAVFKLQCPDPSNWELAACSLHS